ncbi:mandelate racemase/muconate lactonizing enzyme family protein [Amphritea sp. 2_MG-2023]|uniref:mandelate racemase/muconate lactonizing enzyme family protein n=1 Tax=Amphritea TaxID=515417 RepID=UPI001C0745C9|nr:MULTISPECIES: mandelate racemase/muconate lactonizing enzyme family protein [Amphritea]MBU2967093.1 mandelate racemase/muconate lactonizing enzyme family protein [Amphritea atlantica]MDO6419354.1 mandelate racemase/muconate lactonizing enzyme family protein [Amphritea sp. 2_MG-2023]
MSVKIEAIEVYCLQDPQADFVRFEGSYQNVLVVVRGDNGLYGIGESDSPPQIIKALIESAPYNHLSSGLSSVLEGETLDDPRRLWHKMYQSTNWHGRHGIAIHAISALDIALWDLFARTEQRPLYDYFGGMKHQQIPTYATIYPMAEEREAFRQQVIPYLEQGFKRIKICVEPWWADKEKTIQNLYDLRALVGSETHLMLDVAMEFTQLSQLEPFIETLQKLNFKWIEAPFDLDNLHDHRQLRSLTQIPVGVGDLGFTTCKEFLPYIEANAFDIAQPDITMFGGVSETIKLQQLLMHSGKRIIPHAYNTDLTIGVNAHFLCAQQAIEPLEYSTSPSTLRQKLITNPIRVKENGMISIEKDQYGLGLELNWDIIRECTIP